MISKQNEFIHNIIIYHFICISITRIKYKSIKRKPQVRRMSPAYEQLRQPNVQTYHQGRGTFPETMNILLLNLKVKTVPNVCCNPEYVL